LATEVFGVAKRKTKPPASMERDHSGFARVIFYNADLGMISPVVSNYWVRPVEELLRKSGAMFTTNIPDVSCARFIGWCLRRRDAAGFQLGVDNLPVPAWQPHGDEAHPPAGWLDRLLAEASGWDPPAVLVQLDAHKIMRGGRVLWQSELGAVAERMTGEGCGGPAMAEFLALLRQRAAASDSAAPRGRRTTSRKAKHAEPGSAADGEGTGAYPGS
jgi:hypothetical protein